MVSGRLLSVFVIACVFNLVFSGAPVKDIKNYCGQTIQFGSAIRLKLYSYGWPSQYQCEVTLQANCFYHSQSSLVALKFRDVNLDSSLGVCTGSRVDIYDSGNRMTPSGVCGGLPPSTRYKSSGDSIKVRFTKSSFGSSGSFDILATAYSDDICDSSEFMCSGNLECVSEDVTCDGYNNCGDDSDEDFAAGCSLSTTVIAGIVVSIIVFIVLVAGVSGAVYRRRTYGTILWTRSTVVGSCNTSHDQCPPAYARY